MLTDLLTALTVLFCCIVDDVGVHWKCYQTFVVSFPVDIPSELQINTEYLPFLSPQGVPYQSDQIMHGSVGNSPNYLSPSLSHSISMWKYCLMVSMHLDMLGRDMINWTCLKELSLVYAKERSHHCISLCERMSCQVWASGWCIILSESERNEEGSAHLQDWI